MADPVESQLTGLLEAWRLGDAGAADRLLPLVYAQLRRLAAAKMRGERRNHTLEPTALVHEAWLRLTQQQDASWQNRGQFFAIAAQAMRRILVDHARKRDAARRGDGHAPVDLDAVAPALAAPLPDDRLIALDEALDRLAALDARQAQIVELRFFGGLSVEEAADATGLSPTTIKREWAAARAWLFRAIQPNASEEDDP